MKGNGLSSDFVRLMHIPLPFCVLGFATLGASLADRVFIDRLVLTCIGVVLGLCFGAYSLDELHGRPYHTRFSNRTLWFMASAGLLGGAAIGIYLAVVVSIYIIIFVALSVFFILAYNLELFSGRFHTQVWFGVTWGGVTCLASYYVQSQSFTITSLIASAMVSVFSVSIWQLTHRFRREELSRMLNVKIQPTELAEVSKQSRKIAWDVAKIECYTMILLSVALIVPKLMQS